MLKSEIDTYFNENYKLLQSVACGLATKNKRNYDPCILISEAYLHVLNIKDQIDSPDKLQGFVIAKINMESRYTMSKVNRENRSVNINIDEVTINKEDAPYTFNVIDLYLQHENDSLFKYVAEAYIVNGHNTIRKFRSHFKIGQRDTINIIKNLKQRIIDYEQTIQSRV